MNNYKIISTVPFVWTFLVNKKLYQFLNMIRCSLLTVLVFPAEKYCLMVAANTNSTHSTVWQY